MAGPQKDTTLRNERTARQSAAADDPPYKNGLVLPLEGGSVFGAASCHPELVEGRHLHSDSSISASVVYPSTEAA